MKIIKLIITLSFTINLFSNTSILSKNSTYLQTCTQAVEDENFYQNFRSSDAYRGALELEGGHAFAKYILKGPDYIIKKAKELRQLDKIGNPKTHYYRELGKFSGTTLRYIAIASHIDKIFNLPKDAKIVEVGAGFGGQCYIMSKLFPISNYYMFDLDEVNRLIQKIMNQLNVPTSQVLSIYEDLPEEKIDLFISNYAFSECSREMQMEYFHKAIKKSDRGYVIFNTIANMYKIDSISSKEFIALLESEGLKPKLRKEIICTYEGNTLITWDRFK